MHGLGRIVAACGIALAAAPAIPDSDNVFEQLRHEEARVATAAFRIAENGGDLCPEKKPLSGIVFHSLAQYSPSARPAIARYFGMGDTPAAIVLVPGGPAERAGLRPDDQLLAINDTPAPEPGAQAREAPSYAQIQTMRGLLDDAMRSGSAHLTVTSHGTERTADIHPSPGCASLVQLEPSKRMYSNADGSTVGISSALVEFVRSDDELAFIIAHEMAHNILKHGARLDEARVSRGLLRVLPGNAARIRATEWEADRLGIYLMARAGYDPHAVAPFWRRFAHTHLGGLLGDGTHPNDAKRAQAAEAEAEAIDHMRASGLPVAPK